MRHAEDLTLSADQRACYEEWLGLLTQWGTHGPEAAHELALRRAGCDEEPPDPASLARAQADALAGTASRKAN